MHVVPFKTHATLQIVNARFERFTRTRIDQALMLLPQLAVFIRRFSSRARFVWMQRGVDHE